MTDDVQLNNKNGKYYIEIPYTKIPPIFNINKIFTGNNICRPNFKLILKILEIIDYWNPKEEWVINTFKNRNFIL